VNKDPLEASSLRLSFTLNTTYTNVGHSAIQPLIDRDSRYSEERVRGMSHIPLDKWLKKATPDDTGLTWPPVVTRVHKDEVRSILHGYFQSQSRVPVYKEVDRPTHDSIKQEQTLVKVTNIFMSQYIILKDTNQLSKLPSRIDVEAWWMNNEKEEEEGEGECLTIIAIIFIPDFIPICWVKDIDLI
jgi:hypothetical protein